MLNLTSILRMVECGLNGNITELFRLKELIIEEIKIKNAESKGDKARFKTAKKFIEDAIKDNNNAPSLNGVWYDTEYQYLCNGYMVFRLKNHIEGLKEVEKSALRLNSFFNVLKDIDKCSYYIKIDNNLNLSELKTKYAMLKAKYTLAEIKKYKHLQDEDIYFKLENQDEGVKKWFDIRFLILSLEILKDFDNKSFNIYSTKSIYSEIYITNGKDSVFVLPVNSGKE